MSGVYIKMEMPTNCDACPMMTEYYGCVLIGAVGYTLTHRERCDRCPLIPVPPHGDLIDRAELLKRFCGHCFDEHDPEWDFRQCEGECFDIGIIKHTPTIIPAEEGKT